MATVTLIVMERGSTWPGRTGASQDTIVVTGESPAIFRRTANKLLAIQQEGHQVRVAVLACNDAIDPESVARRAKLAYALLKAVASTRVGRVVLTSGDRVSTAVRCDLLSLAGVLSCKPEATLATISVTFDAPSDPRHIAPGALGRPTFGAEMS